MDASSAVTSAAGSTMQTNQSAVDQSIMNFAVALAQHTRSDMTDDLNKLEQKWQQIKRESGET
jgi:hypothetical protein